MTPSISALLNSEASYARQQQTSLTTARELELAEHLLNAVFVPTAVRCCPHFTEG